MLVCMIYNMCGNIKEVINPKTYSHFGRLMIYLYLGEAGFLNLGATVIWGQIILYLWSLSCAL